MNQDFREWLAALLEAHARFLVVGAHAMAVYGVPRATGDLDVWVEATDENAGRVWAALLEFGAPVEAVGVTREDLTRADQVIQIGLPPRRLDVLTSISGGVTFADAWPRRRIVDVDGLDVPFIGRAELLLNKAAAGRAKDKADLEALGKHPDGRSRKKRRDD